MISGLFSVIDPGSGDGWGQTIIFIICLACVFYLNIVGIEVSETFKTMLNFFFAGYMGFEAGKQVKK